MSVNPRRRMWDDLRQSDRIIPNFARPMISRPDTDGTKNYKIMGKIREFKSSMSRLGTFGLLKTDEPPKRAIFTFLNSHYMDHEMIRNGSMWTLKINNRLRMRINGSRRFWTQASGARRSVFSSNINGEPLME